MERHKWCFCHRRLNQGTGLDSMKRAMQGYMLLHCVFIAIIAHVAKAGYNSSVGVPGRDRLNGAFDFRHACPLHIRGV